MPALKIKERALGFTKLALGTGLKDSPAQSLSCHLMTEAHVFGTIPVTG